MPTDDYICTLSGLEPTDAEVIPDDIELDDDNLDELPMGWIRVTVEQRALNGAWVELQRRKSRILQLQQTQVPRDAFESDEDHQDALGDVAWGIAATFAAIEQQTPRFVTLSDEVYIAAPAVRPGVAKAWGQIAEALDIEIGLVADDTTAPDAAPEEDGEKETDED
jgi:hypothetical protein